MDYAKSIGYSGSDYSYMTNPYYTLRIKSSFNKMQTLRLVLIAVLLSFSAIEMAFVCIGINSYNSIGGYIMPLWLIFLNVVLVFLNMPLAFFLAVAYNDASQYEKRMRKYATLSRS